jgi:hypothetical protein
MMSSMWQCMDIGGICPAWHPSGVQHATSQPSHGSCVGLGCTSHDIQHNVWQAMVIDEMHAVWHPYGLHYAANHPSPWQSMGPCWQATHAPKGSVELMWGLGAPTMLSNVWQAMVIDEIQAVCHSCGLHYAGSLLPPWQPMGPCWQAV